MSLAQITSTVPLLPCLLLVHSLQYQPERAFRLDIRLLLLVKAHGTLHGTQHHDSTVCKACEIVLCTAAVLCEGVRVRLKGEQATWRLCSVLTLLAQRVLAWAAAADCRSSTA